MGSDLIIEMLTLTPAAGSIILIEPDVKWLVQPVDIMVDSRRVGIAHPNVRSDAMYRNIGDVDT